MSVSSCALLSLTTCLTMYLKGLTVRSCTASTEVTFALRHTISPDHLQPSCTTRACDINVHEGSLGSYFSVASFKNLFLFYFPILLNIQTFLSFIPNLIKAVIKIVTILSILKAFKNIFIQYISLISGKKLI